MQIQVEQLRKICQNNRRVSKRQRWATANFLITLLPLPLFVKLNSGATTPVTAAVSKLSLIA